MMLGSFYALMAGCLGSAASLSAKLTLGADYFLEMCQVSAFPTQSVSSACHWKMFAAPHPAEAAVCGPDVCVQRCHVDLLLQSSSRLLVFSQRHGHQHGSQLHFIRDTGEDDIWGKSRASVVVGHRSDTLWTADASWVHTAASP
ncbi:uncharacterized protein LOC133539931 isoform X3 [Nerophis ophidion]|uniref:uncharacterized protein LOC133539931 isoform X3 n=1 Tax=Nerophis ophidion TaxID=159077 RepID=UPI002ADF9AFF|nr:uncharacterized protein LOC133539931 isoform X3 [Nerophis ophidion]